jgi:hypothetical protein
MQYDRLCTVQCALVCSREAGLSNAISFIIIIFSYQYKKILQNDTMQRCEWVWPTVETRITAAADGI